MIKGSIIVGSLITLVVLMVIFSDDIELFIRLVWLKHRYRQLLRAVEHHFDGWETTECSEFFNRYQNIIDSIDRSRRGERRDRREEAIPKIGELLTDMYDIIEHDYKLTWFRVVKRG